MFHTMNNEWNFRHILFTFFGNYLGSFSQSESRYMCKVKIHFYKIQFTWYKNIFCHVFEACTFVFSLHSRFLLFICSLSGFLPFPLTLVSCGPQPLEWCSRQQWSCRCIAPCRWPAASPPLFPRPRTPLGCRAPVGWFWACCEWRREKG